MRDQGEVETIGAGTPAAKPLSAATVAMLREVPILASLDEASLHCLDGAREIQLGAGDLLIRQGDLTKNFWIVLEGAMRFVYVGADGRETMGFVMERGESFGEVPLLASVPSTSNVQAAETCTLLELSEEQFWNLVSQCPQVRRAILANLAIRLAKVQNATFQQEKMVALGTLAAGLMHELNNPSSAARRASAQLRENLLRMHVLTAKFARRELSTEQRECMSELQDFALETRPAISLSSIEQADAEEALADWMDAARVEGAWKLAPTLVTIGMDAEHLACARSTFDGQTFSDALNWLEALVSSMQLAATIEESIGRVTDLVKAVKSYAYESRGQKQEVDVNQSIHATLVILGHKLREKQIVLKKSLQPGLPMLHTPCQGLNQVWTNLLDNAIDAAPQGGTIQLRTWIEPRLSNVTDVDPKSVDLCILVADNGAGIPLESQTHIFEHFYTTKAAGVGTGLGLGIVHRIVEQAGGSVRFSSIPGETEFVVRIPAEVG